MRWCWRIAVRRWLALALAGALAGGVWAVPRRAAGTGQQSDAPSAEDVRRMAERVIENQRRNELALAEYERRERRREARDADFRDISEDKTFRVVPTGTGTLRLVVEENGKAVSADFYTEQLRTLEEILDTAANRPQDPRHRRAAERAAERSRDRQELVDAVREAFRIEWLGRETRNGRTLAKVRLVPNPSFRPRTRIQSVFQNVEAVVWVDEEAAQLVRAEADIVRDISFGGGLFGKVYRGGRFVMEQSRVGEDLWMPALYRFDYSGRRFIFGFSVHQETRVSAYRRIGPPAEALAEVRRELAGQPRASRSAQP